MTSSTTKSETPAISSGTLDGLLDFCFDPEALLLYRKLCRYYFTIDPVATAFYPLPRDVGLRAGGIAMRIRRIRGQQNSQKRGRKE